jgi:transposase
MVKAYSGDLRGRVLDAVKGGLSCRAAARRFGVATSTAIKWVARWRQTGSHSALPQGGDQRSGRIEAYRAEIMVLVEDKPDIRLHEIANHLYEAHGLMVAPSTVWRFFDRHAVTFKKNRARQRATTA